MIDDKSLKKYKSFKGDYRKTMLANIDNKEQCFVQEDNRRCSFLNCDNLCEMYINAGEDMLCKTCRKYPRHFEEFENFRTVNLSISCPEVARIILGRKSKVKFRYMTTEREEKPYEYFDFMLFTKLQQIQEYLIGVLQERSLDLNIRVAIALGCAHDLQKRIDNNKLYEIDDLLDRYYDKSFKNKAVNTVARIKKDTSKANTILGRARIFMNMHNLEVLSEEWPEYMAECEKTLYDSGIDYYFEIEDEFNRYYYDRMVEYEQIVVYFIATYFLGAVYDDQLYDKVVFAIASMLFIKEMDMATYVMNNGKLSFEQQVDIVHKYSRELEHSDPNVELFENMIAERGEYTADALIKLL